MDKEELYKKAFKLACKTIAEQENDSCYYCIYRDRCFNKEHFGEGSCPANKWEEFFIKEVSRI